MKIKNKAMRTFSPEFKSGSMSTFAANDIGPIKRTSSPPPNKIRTHIVKMNPKIETFTSIQHPLRMH